MLKRTILVAIIFATLLTSLPAGATTCLCVGSGSSKTCGNGGAGGTFLDVYTRSSDSLKSWLKTAGKQAELDSNGRVYDPNTGWFCWNGDLH